MKPVPMAERMREQWMSHHVRQRLVGVLGILEDIIYVLLAMLLFASALYIVGATLVHADFRSVPNLINSILDRFLVILMLAELVHTLLLFLKTHRFRYQPFLVVGIIAAIRRILVVTAQAVIAPTRIQLRDYLLDLGVTTLVALALTMALRWGPSTDDF